MALTFPASHYVAEDWVTPQYTRTMSVDSGSGPQRVLLSVVQTDRYKNGYILSATYGGASMTIGPQVLYANREVRLFYLYNPPAGVNSLVVTCLDSSSRIGAWGGCYDGLTATPVANVVGVNNAGTNWSNISLTQTAAAGQQAVVMAWRELPGVSYTSGTLTERYDANSRYIADILSSGPSAMLAFASASSSGGYYYTFALDLAGGITVKKVYARLVNASGAPLTNQTGIRYAYWDATTPDACVGSPLHSGTAETTDTNGYIEVLVPDSAKLNGETGFLVLSNTDGSVAQTPAASCFAGPVLVTVTTS
jgi:hypothetical protein